MVRLGKYTEKKQAAPVGSSLLVFFGGFLVAAVQEAGLAVALAGCRKHSSSTQKMRPTLLLRLQGLHG